MARLIFLRSAGRPVLAFLSAVCFVAATIAALLLVIAHFDLITPAPPTPKSRCETPLRVGEHKFTVLVRDGRLMYSCRWRV